MTFLTALLLFSQELEFAINY